MRNKKSQYLVLGLGRFGTSVATSLEEQDIEVLAVDVNKDLVDDIAPYVTGAVQMDATDDDALASLDVPAFDGAVVAIGTDIRASVLICVTLKELGVRYVVAKANDDMHAKVLAKIGVDRVVFPERDMGARLARFIATPLVLQQMHLSDGYQIMELSLPAHWEGKTLKALDIRRKYALNVVAIHRNDLFMAAPAPDMPLEKGDILLLLGKERDVERIKAQE